MFPADHGGLRGFLAPSDRLHARGDDLQAAFCLVIYNLLQVIRAYVAASQVEMPVDAVSVGPQSLRGRAKRTDRIDRVVPIPDDCRLVCNGNVA